MPPRQRLVHRESTTQAVIEGSHGVLAAVLVGLALVTAVSHGLASRLDDVHSALRIRRRWNTRPTRWRIRHRRPTRWWRALRRVRAGHARRDVDPAVIEEQLDHGAHLPSGTASGLVWTINSVGNRQCMSALLIALAFVAAILAGIEIFMSRGRALLPWAVECLALIAVIPALASI